MPGQLFQTTGQTANSWYEILMPDNRIAYISGKLVYFKPYSTARQAVPAPQPPAAPTPAPYNYSTNLDRIPYINNLPPTVEHSYYGEPVAVYSGPGTAYARAAGGQATLGGGIIKIWGTDGDWALVGYGLSNNLYRVGYILADVLSGSVYMQPIAFSYREVTVISPASLTDDPIINPTWLFEIPVGTRVTLLAYETFAEHWAYIETYYGGQPVRGFINRARITEEPVYSATQAMPPQPTYYPCPSETVYITGSGVLPPTKSFSYTADPQAIYSGPGTHYHRAANGRATMGGGSLRIWGTTNGWAMIGYGLSNNLYRVGYMRASALPYGVCVPEIVFNNQTATITSTAALTDDPILHPTWLFEIPAGTQVTLLAYENFASISETSRKVAKAVSILHEKYPKMIVDGETQPDFAMNADHLADYPFSKLGSTPANTFVFPNLESANIAYKIIRGMKVAQVVGPILMGLKQPVHVLQMRASVDEIVNLATIAVLDAQRREVKHV